MTVKSEHRFVGLTNFLGFENRFVFITLYRLPSVRLFRLLVSAE